MGPRGGVTGPSCPPAGDMAPCGLEELSLVQGWGAAASVHAAIQEAWDKKHPPGRQNAIIYTHICIPTLFQILFPYESFQNIE